MRGTDARLTLGRDDPPADLRPRTSWVCDHCGRHIPGWRRRCPWCRLAPLDAAVDALDAHDMAVRHRLRVECLTCSRVTTLGESAAGAGRCRTCGGTLVWREVL